MRDMEMEEHLFNDASRNIERLLNSSIQEDEEIKMAINQILRMLQYLITSR